MKTIVRVVTFLAAAVLSAFALTACGEYPLPSEPFDPCLHGADGLCLPPGSFQGAPVPRVCARRDDCPRGCCDTVSHTCVAVGPLCHVAGEACSDGDHCVTGCCPGGVCASAGMGCDTAGSPCAYSDQCASACCAPAAGVMACAELAFCG